MKWIRKASRYLRCHLKSAIVITIQFGFIVWLKTNTGSFKGQTTRGCEYQSSPSQILNYARMSPLPFNKYKIKGFGVKIIQHGKSEVAEFGKVDAETYGCDMDSYLTQSQEICERIINGNRQTSNNVNEDTHKFVRDTSCDLLNTEGNCHVIRKSYMFGKEQITQEEKSFPLAFGMKIHGSVNQAHRLLRYIYRPHNIYCIHVDKKAQDSVFQSTKHLTKCFDNIVVIEDRVRVVYSSIRQVEAELRCLKAVKQTPVKWKYYINLTGQEFPLKTNLEIVKYLKSLNNTNDIESHQVPGDHLHRFTQKRVLVNDKIINTRQRKPPFKHKIRLRKGGAYGMFTREFVIFVLNHSLVKEFIDWLEDTYAPEETIWASLNALPETPGGTTGERTFSNGLYQSRAVKWQTDKINRCQGKYVHWVCIYGVDDLSWLLNRHEIIANKFYETFEPLALTCLEMVMYKRLLGL